jgi:D-inositol-3-phosphate glycosyltransferase
VTATHITLLTGGGDKPYAVGLTEALLERGVSIDFIGSTELDCPEITSRKGVTFLNFRRDQQEGVSTWRKALRSSRFYMTLFAYAATARAKIFHILWNNRFAFLDRVVLMLYYRLLGKRVVMTAHNVNAGKRDGNDSFYNRLTLRIQYLLCDHLFVHTDLMKREMIADFSIVPDRISVIPFGLNDTTPKTDLTTADARRRLGLGSNEKVLLFFGQIAPYKGLEYLIEALTALKSRGQSYRLVIAGRIKLGRDGYGSDMRSAIQSNALGGNVIEHIRFIPDEDVEIYFKAADVVAIPYTHIFQSGVPFLAYSFGLPVLATDVGSLRDDIVEGETGFLCPPRNAAALAVTIERYFSSDLYRELPVRRARIRQFAAERHSWATVGQLTEAVYTRLLRGISPAARTEHSSAS